MEFTTCKYRLAAKKLRKLAIKGGILKNHLPPKCPRKKPAHSKPCPCTNFLENARAVYAVSADLEVSQPLLSMLGDLFGTSSPTGSDFHPKLVRQNKFWCPELHLTMYQACEVKSCKFHSTGNEWTGNCVLRYMTKHQTGTLSYNDLTFLLDKPTHELRADLSAALKKLRNSALKEIMVRDNPGGLFDRLKSDRICPVCERPISKHKKLVKRGYAYCSETCLDRKPPTVLDLEHEFCVDVKILLKTCTERFESAVFMSTAIGVGKPMFLELCEANGIELSEEKL